ncbi:RadC family protein [Desulfovulcanus sp.]
MKNQPHYLGHRKRLKEKLRKDPSLLEDYEVLELLLSYALPRKDTKPLAKELLDRFGSFKEILFARTSQFEQVPGIGQGISTFWLLWREFWSRLEQSDFKPKIVLDSPGKVAGLAKTRLSFLEIEEFWMILVDTKNRLLAFERLCSGTVDQAPVFPREVIARALELKASGLILLHNHPGGDPRPSLQDFQLTKRLQKIAKDLGLRVLDHIIIGQDNYFSFQEEGNM